jgi:hypothetical protein
MSEKPPKKSPSEQVAYLYFSGSNRTYIQKAAPGARSVTFTSSQTVVVPFGHVCTIFSAE